MLIGESLRQKKIQISYDFTSTVLHITSVNLGQDWIHCFLQLLVFLHFSPSPHVSTSWFIFLHPQSQSVQATPWLISWPQNIFMYTLAKDKQFPTAVNKEYTSYRLFPPSWQVLRFFLMQKKPLYLMVIVTE
jgi:hypothetical protein